jgi:hypothetical protein
VTYPTDDLASVLLAPAREHTGYGQALIREWDSDTFENTVEYRGALLHDLPVLDRVGALTYQPGDVILLMKWNPTGRGLASYWIAGSPVVPAAGRAEAAIAFLSSNLAKSISAQVFASQIHVAEVAGFATLEGDDTFGDLSDEVGPTVANVTVVSGVAVAMISARIQTVLPSGVGTTIGYMGVQVSGATSVSADIANSFRVGNGNTSGSTGRVDDVRATAVYPLTGLNAGEHTFTAKYRTGPSANVVGFDSRALTVIAL